MSLRFGAVISAVVLSSCDEPRELAYVEIDTFLATF